MGEIIAAHEEMRSYNPNYKDVIDSCTLYRLLGKQTYLTEGVRGNIKITNPVDLYIFKAWLEFKKNNEAVIGIPTLEDYYESLSGDPMTLRLKKHEQDN